MEDRPVRLLEIAVARHTLELPPRFAPGVTVRAEVAPARPVIIRALLIGTELLLRVDSAAASSGEHEQWRWGGGRRWTARESRRGGYRARCGSLRGPHHVE